MKKIKAAYAFLLIAVMSCTIDDGTDLPEEPRISWKEWELEQDSIDGQLRQFIYVTFEYEDGNGDVGVRNFEENTDSIPDLYVDYFELREGKFTKIPACIGCDTLAYTYFMPNLTPTGNNKAIRGEMRIKINARDVPRDTLKTVQYKIYLFDRARNRSNIITSPEIEYQTPPS